MSKLKHSKDIENSVIHPIAEKVGAVVLTAISLLVTFEAIIEHNPKFGKHGGEEHSNVLSTEIYARAETKGEGARLPEEFDIGLQTPHVSGL